MLVNILLDLQVTVGGYTRDGAEGYNDITLMCLKACRRLPLNAPCVSLRLTTNPPPLVVEEAAKALLSGGAHPILYNDDKMVEGLSIAFLTRTITLSVLYMLKLCI